MTRNPGDPMKRPVKTMVEEATARITTLSMERVQELLDDPDHLIVDIRDPRERERDGSVPGAYPAPRGMLEFWIDPESPYYKPKLDDGRTLVLYCGGAWRSALATDVLQQMGRENVVHMEGGFLAWKKGGFPVESVERR